MFYSKETGGFYSLEIHGVDMPADAVEVSKKEYAKLMQGQASGKRITADANGFPILAGPAAPTVDDLALAARGARIPLLAEADVAILRREDAGADTSEWRKYRQDLRDITIQATFPTNIIWPTRPE